MNRGYDTAVRVELANDIISMAENYNSWANLDASKSEFVEEVLERLFNFGLEME